MATIGHITLVILAMVTMEVQARIVFVHQPASTAVLIGGELVLNCTARETNGNLPLTYHWEFNSEPVYMSVPKASVFQNHSLYVSPVDAAVLGTYVCIVEGEQDPADSVRSTPATVVEAYIEEFVIHPESMSVVNGNATIMECVSGKSAPPALVHWERYGQLVTQGQQTNGTFGSIGPGGAAQISSKLELVVTPDLAGEYTCVAENPLTSQLRRSNISNLTVSVLDIAPEILTTSPSDVLAPAGMPLTLHCLTTGQPKPEITWFKSTGQLVVSDRITKLTNGSLHFVELRETDRGIFRCVAVNVVGSVRSPTVNLTVAVLDVNFTRSPSNVTVRSGQQVALLCLPPRSIPPARVLWYKDNTPFTERSGEFDVRQLPTGALQFSNIQLQDEGRYFCVAVNNYSMPSSRTSQIGSIVVREASPIFVEPPVPARIIKGSVLSLTCRVEARPKATVQWYKDGDLIKPGQRVSFQDSRQVLVIRTVNKDDQGLYLCNATNPYGVRTSAPVQVFVIVPPEIVLPPEDITVQEREDVFVRCQVYGDPDPEVKWYKDGTAVSITDRLMKTEKGLQIGDVSSDDEGVYQCEARNEGGVKTAQATLLIKVIPILFTYPVDQHVTMDTPTSLHCEATGVPSPVYYWTFNGTRSLPEATEVKQDGQTLHIASPSPRHTGTYVCYAQNKAGTDSSSASLIVEVKPTISNISGETLVDQGNDLHLTCEVTGIPTPSIAWYHDNQQLISTTDARIVFPKFDQLTIRYVRGYNSGKYLCVAVNDVGRDEAEVTVYVRETPFPPELIAVLPVSMTSVNLTWQSAKQDPNNMVDSFVIQYKESISQAFSTFHDDVPADYQSYEVSGLLAFTEYVFRVAAKNHIGVGVFSAALGVRTLETAPSEPRNLKMVSHNATAVELQWEVPAVTNGDIRLYQVQYKKKYNTEEYSVKEISTPSLPLQHDIVTDLQPYTTYEFKVRGANIEATLTLWGAFSMSLDITTSVAVPSAAPPDLNVQVLTSRSIQVRWKDLPSEYHNGPLQGYMVRYKLNETSQPYTDIIVSPTLFYVNVTQLSPWRYYDVAVAAYNNKGRGVTSQIVTVRTLPEAPSSAPVDVQVAALSDSTLHVQWKSPSQSEQNSDISGYNVEYKRVAMETGMDATWSIDSGDPDSSELNITGLEAYMEYEVRVQAFTTQVTNGFGPYSPPVTVWTKQGIPGPVRNVTATLVPSGVTLSWLPPFDRRGVISLYVVTYSVLLPTDVITAHRRQGATQGRRVSRAVGEWVSNNTWEVTTNETTVTITGLDPGTNYSLSVTAVTAGGRGLTPTILAATIVASIGSDSDDGVMTTEPSAGITMVTVDQGAQREGTTAPPVDRYRNDTPVIIGASVAGGLVLVILILLLIYCLCRRQRHRKGIYFIPPMAFTQQTLADLQAENSANTQREKSDRSASPANTDTTVVHGSSGNSRDPETGDSSIAPNEGATSVESIAATRPMSEGGYGAVQMLPGALPLDPMFDLSYASMDDLHLAHLQGASYPYLSNGRGLENPAYDPDLSSSMSPGHTDMTFFRPSVYTSQQDLYSQVHGNKKRKNRMKSQTAAAIAAQRNATSSMFLDTDALIKNDSVVVYDERTAL